MANLIVQTAYPGDLLLSIPLIQEFRRVSPETELVVACRSGLGDLMNRLNLVDRVIEINKRDPAARDHSWKSIQREVWDTVVVPHMSVRTTFWMARTKAKNVKVGFEKWWTKWSYGQRVVRPVDYPDALRQLSLLCPIDDTTASRFSDPDLQELRNPFQRNDRVDLRLTPIPEWASMRLFENVPIAPRICLAPGSVWATKRWTEQGFTELADLLLRRGYVVDLVGSPDETEICARIAGSVKGVTNRAGTTSLYGLIEHFAQSSALVCNDSGAMHAASVAGLPTVSLFGPTTLDLGFRPWNDRAIVLQKNLNCRPCGPHGAKKCPIGTHDCMKQLPAMLALKAVEDLLSNP